MRFIVLLLLFIDVSYGQTFQDALNFLKINEPDWACEKFASGSLDKRLTFSSNKESTHLTMKVALPKETINGLNVLRENKFTFATNTTKIDLSKIKRIDIQEATGCITILIVTEPYGIEGKVVGDYGYVIMSNSKYNTFLEENGWSDDAIKIKNNSYGLERANRIKKALEFMAVENGADLQESYF